MSTRQFTTFEDFAQEIDYQTLKVENDKLKQTIADLEGKNADLKEKIKSCQDGFTSEDFADKLNKLDPVITLMSVQNKLNELQLTIAIHSQGIKDALYLANKADIKLDLMMNLIMKGVEDSKNN